MRNRFTGYAAAAAGALLLAFLQSPGTIAADTKLDLTANPLGFLGRAAHLWSSQAPMGQVQNQAYGYFFPHGAFFALGEILSIPPWITQRLWWALLLWLGFVGILRLADALGIGSTGSRVFAAAAFALSPRVVTTLGSISSETLPLMLAPWVLTPVVLALDRDDPPKSLRRLAFGSAVAIAFMGAVNAVATAAAVAVSVGWFVLHRPTRRWCVFGGWWALGTAMACLWWLIPLAILGAVSPPFLDFIESSSVTTEWANLPEVLRGTSAWTPFVSPERAAGAVLVTEPAAVVATGVIAAAGLTGLAMRSMRWRGPLTALLLVGLVLICVGYLGQLGSPIAEPVRAFLDGSGAALRNVHKWDPLIRIPLTLGLAHALAKVPYPRALREIPSTARIFAHPERTPLVAMAIALTVALVGASSMAWAGNLAPAGSYKAVPEYWKQTAQWLEKNPGRALVTPGAPFADQTWGLTRDEPLQGLAGSPWAVRDAIPLTPPGAIRALDSVQRLVAAGMPSAGLAPTLAQQGIRYVVVRADLSPGTSRSARPALAQQAIRDSPGMSLATTFGPTFGAATVDGIVSDDGLRPPIPAISIYRVDATVGTDRPSLVDADSMPRVDGGPEVLARLQQSRAMSGQPPISAALTTGDARAAGLGAGPFIATDTPTDREVDFGRVDNNTSAIRAGGDPRTTTNAAADYPTNQALTSGQWLLNGAPHQIGVTASSSASDATQLGQVAPALGPPAAFDNDPNTSWVSGGLDSAVGQWLSLNFTEPQRNLALTVTTGKALGPNVTAVLIKTDSGSTVMQGISPGTPFKIVAPPEPTRHLQIKAIATENSTAGNQFAISELSIRTAGSQTPIAIRHTVTLPTLRATDSVTAWILGQDLLGRSECVDAGNDRTPCSAGLSLRPEEPGVFTRTLSVPQPTALDPRITLRPKPGSDLSAMISSAGGPHLTASGDGQISDPRGTAAAVVDGDPGTTWYAPQPPEKKSEKKKYRPQVTVSLPHAERVHSLKVVAPQSQYPARPTRVQVEINGVTSEHALGKDGTVTLDGATTDRIRLTVVAYADVLNVNSLGFAQQAPPGIAEVQVNGKPNADTSSERITVSCDDRRVPGLTAAGQVIRFGFSATAGELRRGEPIVATPCAAEPLRLPAGPIEIAANPTGAFTVDTVALTKVPSPSANTTSPQYLSPQKWTADRREVSVGAADRDRVLVVTEAVNPGRTASIGDRSLTPITVNGWQQGFIVPAGVGGTVAMDYPLDTPYRWALLVGLILVAALLLATLLTSRDRSSRDDSATGLWRAPVLAGAGWLSAMGLIGGPIGLAVAAVSAVVAYVMPRPAALTMAGSCCATVALAIGPWHSATYAGWTWWAQAPALVAVAAATASFLRRRPGN